MTDRLLCTLAEMIDDLELNGIIASDEPKFVERRIRAASKWIERRNGMFVPLTEVRNFDGLGGQVLFVGELLSVTSIVAGGVTLATTDYVLYPRSRYWENGPYTRIEIDPDASALSAWPTKRDDVVITGQWGKYTETHTTGTTVANTTQIDASQTDLKVSNGSKVSPGMVLKIESEQLLVEATGARTTATSVLTEALDATEEEIDVTSGAEFNVGEVFRVELEDFRIKDIGGNTLYVDRGWNGTQKATHAISTAISLYRTYTVKRNVNGTSAATHANGTAISRYVIPADVNWLAREIAGLMHKKAKGGFAGKSGDAELGTIYYHDEFPKKQSEDVFKNYRIVSL